MKPRAERPILGRAWRVGLTAALAAATVSAAVAGSALAAYPGANGKLAFSRGGLPDVYTVNTDGSAETNLTSSSRADINPVWSPDGSQIVFATTQGATGDFEIFKMNGDGTGAVAVGGTTDIDWQPTWSPDGVQVAFSGTHRDVYVVNADGTGLTNVTNSADREEAPSWSPDGTKIAFQGRYDSEPLPNYDIHLMNPDGTGQLNLTNNTLGGDYYPDWSPDGSKIAFSSNRDGNNEVYAMDADGNNQTRLTTNLSFDGEPSWSPDGHKILFTSNRDGDTEIYIMNPDGSGQTALTTNTVDDSYPDWQPVPSAAPPYDVPQSASTLHVTLVPDFRQTISQLQCAARGGQVSAHGPPLAFDSCNPPAVVPGFAARLGPQSMGDVILMAIPGNPSTVADEADLNIDASITDVRDTALAGDYDPNPSGPDLTMLARWRVSDTFNGVTESDSATVTDFELPALLDCTATADPSVGSDCALSTTADALMPGSIGDGRDMVVQLFRTRLRDSGSDGTPGTSDDRSLAMQGIFIP